MSKFIYINITPLDPATFDAIKRGILSTPYSADNKRRIGFICHQCDSKAIHADFIERIEYMETVTDPLGRKIEWERVKFELTRFHIILNDKIIECENPPRSIKGFTNEIASFTNYSSALSKLSINVNSFIKHTKLCDRQAMLTKASTQPFQISEQATAQLEAQGTNDIQKTISKFLDSRNPTFNNAAISAKLCESPLTLRISQSGLLTTDRDIDRDEREILRKIAIASA